MPACLQVRLAVLREHFVHHAHIPPPIHTLPPTTALSAIERQHEGAGAAGGRDIVFLYGKTMRRAVMLEILGLQRAQGRDHDEDTSAGTE
jgi:hypothetical protein